MSDDAAPGPAKRRITETVARADFLAMGPGRTLMGLLKRYRHDAGVRPPGEATLKRWSAEHKWKALAEQHDGNVTARTIAAVEERQVATRTAVLERTHGTSLKILGRIEALLIRLDDPASAVDILLRLQNHAALAEGGVTERTEQRSVTAEDGPGSLAAIRAWATKVTGQATNDAAKSDADGGDRKAG